MAPAAERRGPPPATARRTARRPRRESRHRPRHPRPGAARRCRSTSATTGDGGSKSWRVVGQAIAGATHGDDEIGAELAPQAVHVHFDGVAFDFLAERVN